VQTYSRSWVGHVYEVATNSSPRSPRWGALQGADLAARSHSGTALVVCRKTPAVAKRAKRSAPNSAGDQGTDTIACIEVPRRWRAPPRARRQATDLCLAQLAALGLCVREGSQARDVPNRTSWKSRGPLFMATGNALDRLQVAFEIRQQGLRWRQRLARFANGRLGTNAMVALEDKRCMRGSVVMPMLPASQKEHEQFSPPPSSMGPVGVSDSVRFECWLAWGPRC